MSCNKPLKGFKVGVKDSGKDDFYITDYRVHHVEYANGQWRKAYSSFISPNCDQVVHTSIDIPCGHCLACKSEFAKMWSARCYLEMKKYPVNLFITLTYDDDHIPKNINPDSLADTNVDISGMYNSLRKTDLQKFFKRLRKKGFEFRYYACGEYGNLGRPHYHIIAFGLDLKDLVPSGKYYESPTILDLWPFGYHSIAEATLETCSYTTKYVLKKLYKQDFDLDTYGIEKPFTLMSRKPGIGFDWYDQHKANLFDNNGSIQIANGMKVSVPKYFKKKFSELYPEEYQKVREETDQFMVNLKNNLVLSNDKDYLDILADKELCLSAKVNESLKRRKL